MTLLMGPFVYANNLGISLPWGSLFYFEIFYSREMLYNYIKEINDSMTLSRVCKQMFKIPN
jgi:hypothetical protein